MSETTTWPFKSGDVLTHEARGEHLLVLNYNKERQTYLLMPLPKGHGETFSATQTEIDGWDLAYLPGPRFVEVLKKGTEEIEWSGYLPDFESALSLYFELECCDDPQHEVSINAQHDDERGVLDRANYYKPPDGFET